MLTDNNKQKSLSLVKLQSKASLTCGAGQLLLSDLLQLEDLL